MPVPQGRFRVRVRVAPLVATAIVAALVAHHLSVRSPADVAAVKLVEASAVTSPPPTATTTVTSAPLVTTTTETTATTATTATTVTTEAKPTPTTVTTRATPPPTTVSRSTTAAGSHTETLVLASGDASGLGRAAWVYKPAVPDSDDLPVLYFLHGLPGSARDFESAGLASFLDQAFAAGAPPFMVVVPDGNSPLRADTEWADAGDGAIRLETFLVSTLMSAVEGDHPRDRRRRAIGGFSMGGYGAMNVALHHPNLFGQVVSIAGYFHSDDPDGMSAGQPDWAAANSPDQHVPSGSALRMFLVADADEADPLIAGEAQRFARLAQGAGQKPALLVAPGAHNWSFVAGVFPDVARFLSSGW